MDKGNSHTNLGLSQKELELLVNNSNDPELLKKYEERLENCDLSKSAIELIEQDNLEAIARITNSVSSKYPLPQSKDIGKFILGGLAAVGICIGIFTYENTEEEFTSPNHEPMTIIESPSNSSINNVNENEQQTTISIESKINNAETNIETIDSANHLNKLTNEQFNQPDSSENPIKNLVNNEEDKASKETEVEKEKIKKEKVEYVKVKEERQVRNITTTESVSAKYKDVDYRLSDLVSYSGGKKQLEQILFNKLKDKVKDSDVPKRNSSIVFKFNVSSKGKVRDINVLSLVSPELEEIIRGTTLELTNWNKGKKRIPRDYTVYITFK